MLFIGKYLIIVAVFVVIAARAQEAVPLFPKGEIFYTDPLTTIGRSVRDIVKYGDYLLFDVAVNDTLGLIIIYKKDSSSGEYSEVNRIQGTILLADGMTSNGEWIATYDGMNREVNFFQLDANHQVVNNVKWSYISLAIWYRSFRLMPDNNFVTVDFSGGKIKVLIYEYSSNNWAGTSVFSITTPSAEATYLTDTGVVILDVINSVVSLYEYHGNNFTFVENITLPFSLRPTGRNAFAYDGVNTLVFVDSTDQVTFVERNLDLDGWEVKYASWNMTDNANLMRTYFNFHMGKVFVAHYEYNRGNPLQGAIFEFTKSGQDWNNTAVYRPYSPVFTDEGFQTNAAFAFAITDEAVFGLAKSHSTENQASFAGYQMQYVLLPCYNEPLDISCQDREVACNTNSIAAADLVTVSEPCGEVVVTSNDQSTIALDFGSSKSVTVTLNALRFGVTAQCEVTIRCNPDIIPAEGPLRAPGSRSPQSATSGAKNVVSATIATVLLVLSLAMLQ